MSKASKSTKAAERAAEQDVKRRDAERYLTQVVGYFRSNSDRDEVTATKARHVFTVTRQHGVSLGVLQSALSTAFAAAADTKQGGLTAVPSKASLSNYGKAYEHAVTAGVQDDARSVARLFTTISASAVAPAELAERVKSIGSMPEGERVDAVAAIPTSKAAARKSSPAARKGEGDDATTDLIGSEAVTVSAVVQGLGTLAARIDAGQLTEADVRKLTAAWGKVSKAIAGQASTEAVETVVAALAAA